MRESNSKCIAWAVLAALLGCTAFTGCSALEGTTVPVESSAPTEETQASDAADASPDGQAGETAQETAAETTEHVSPTETVTSQLGTQIDVDVTLDRDSAGDSGKNYKVPLSRLIQAGDIPSSFTFVFYASDGSSDIGTYKGGCGISVTDDCAAATDPGWYQSDDFEVQANGAYVEVTWNVPGDIASCIAPDGAVQIGYWWGNIPKVNLKNIICTYTRTETLPVDGTQTIPVGQTLRMNDETANSVRIPLGDVLGEEGVPQAITFDITGQGAFHKFTGAFGISAGEWYQSDTVAVLTDSGSLSLTWIIPQNIRWDVPKNGEVMLGYWWSEGGDVTLNSVTVKYSIGGARPAEAQPDTVTPADNQEVADRMKQDGRAAAIVKDIRVGWNLGNTLDSYDKNGAKKIDDFETYWGNPKTTKAMFDTVKAKGFNAVRIPVSWTNHLDDAGNIDAAWLDRVQEVVDYAMEDDLYVILNVHHDDYTWIHPVYAEEEAVTTRYTHLWEQIAGRFRDYDLKLLFEGLNEPRMVGSANEWMGGTEEERTVINHLLAKFVEVVRASGGKNADRTLIVTTHAASITEAAVNGLVLPADGNLIVSIHNYSPWKFTTGDYPNDKVFDDAAKAELDGQFDMLQSKFVSRGIPVIIGEFGAENKSNDTDRDAYYSYYVQAAARRGIPCFLWDNGLSSSYAVLDRKNVTWLDNGIADAVEQATK